MFADVVLLEILTFTGAFLPLSLVFDEIDLPQTRLIILQSVEIVPRQVIFVLLVVLVEDLQTVLYHVG